MFSLAGVCTEVFQILCSGCTSIFWYKFPFCFSAGHSHTAESYFDSMSSDNTHHPAGVKDCDLTKLASKKLLVKLKDGVDKLKTITI